MYLDAHLFLVNGISILDIVGLDLAVLELNTLGNLLEVVGCHVLVEINVIDFLLEELRMGEFRSKVTIVCQQEDTGGVTVEATYGINALGACTLDEIHDRLALLGVVAGSDVVLGFVEQHIDFLLEVNGLVVETYLVGTKHLAAQFGNHLTVDGDDTCLDELVSLTTAANASIGEELVQTQGLVGIVIFLLVLDTLLHAVLCIGIVICRTGTESAGSLVIAATLLVAAAGLEFAISAASLIATALLVATTLLVAATRLIALIGTLLVVAAFFIIVVTRTVSLMGTLCIVVVVAGLITTTLLVVITGLIAATGLVAVLTISLIIIVARTIAATLWLPTLLLQGSPEAFGAESLLVVLIAMVVTATVLIVGTRFLNAWTRCAPNRTIALIAILVWLIAFTVSSVLFYRLFVLSYFIFKFHSFTLHFFLSLTADFCYYINVRAYLLYI